MQNQTTQNTKQPQANSQIFDAIIIGAGAAGMMCAANLGQQNKKVLLLDHSQKIGEKIRISGGGRCNFTNKNLENSDTSQFFVSENPNFVRYPIAQFTPSDFMDLLDSYKIAYHEKHKGQMFCDKSAKDIIFMLQKECEKGKVVWKNPVKVEKISVQNFLDFADNSKESFENNLEESFADNQAENPHTIFFIKTDLGDLRAKNLIIATGGLAVPLIGASPFGYEIAKNFGHRIVKPEAALVPLQFEDWQTSGLDTLAGISLPIKISTKYATATNKSHKSKKSNLKRLIFEEDLLFRHKGLTGPAILQISSYWQSGQILELDLYPNLNFAEILCEQKAGKKISLHKAINTLAPDLPKRLVDFWLDRVEFRNYANRNWADIPNQVLQNLGISLNRWQLIPSGNDGHKKAEATRGGVATDEINPKTMESKLQKNLYFIGEVLDITGWLGGYNFQWAWSSAFVAAQNIVKF